MIPNVLNQKIKSNVTDSSLKMLD